MLAAKNEALKLRAAKCKSLESEIEEQRLELQRFRCIVTAEENLKVDRRIESIYNLEWPSAKAIHSFEEHVT